MISWDLKSSKIQFFKNSKMFFFLKSKHQSSGIFQSTFLNPIQISIFAQFVEFCLSVYSVLFCSPQRSALVDYWECPWLSPFGPAAVAVRLDRCRFGTLNSSADGAMEEVDDPLNQFDNKVLNLETLRQLQILKYIKVNFFGVL